MCMYTVRGTITNHERPIQARPPKDETLCRYVFRSGKCDFEEVRGFKCVYVHEDDGWRFEMLPAARVLNSFASFCSFKHPPGTVTVEMRKPVNERLESRDYRNELRSDSENWGPSRSPPPRSLSDRIWGWDRGDQRRRSPEPLPFRESVSFGHYEDRHREPYLSSSLDSLHSRESARERDRMDLRYTIGRQDSSRDREWERERERSSDDGRGSNHAPFDRDLRRTIEDRRQRESPVASRGPDDTTRRDGVCERRCHGRIAFVQAQSIQDLMWLFAAVGAH